MYTDPNSKPDISIGIFDFRAPLWNQTKSGGMHWNQCGVERGSPPGEGGIYNSISVVVVESVSSKQWSLL